MRKCRRRRNSVPAPAAMRSGYTLVEMLVVIMALAVVLATAGVVLHGIFRVNAQVWSQRAAETAVWDLAHQLRADAHSAVQAALAQGAGTGGSGVSLRQEDGAMVQYLADGDAVIRLRRTGGRITHRERYWPGEAAQVHWSMDRTGTQPVIVCLISQPQRPHGEPEPALRIEAAVGLDGVFEETNHEN